MLMLNKFMNKKKFISKYFSCIKFLGIKDGHISISHDDGEVRRIEIQFPA